MLIPLVSLVFGLVVGTLARLVAPGRESGGWVLSMLLGGVGAIGGGMLGRALGWFHPGQAVGFFFSLCSSIAFVAVYVALRSRSDEAGGRERADTSHGRDRHVVVSTARGRTTEARSGRR